MYRDSQAALDVETGPTAGRDEDRMAARYGTSSTLTKRSWVAIAIATIVAAAAIAVWLAFSNQANHIAYDVAGSTPLGETRLEVTYTVGAPIGSTFSCALEAVDAKHAIVGWKIIDGVSRSTSAQEHRDVVITLRQAVAVTSHPAGSPTTRARLEF